MWNKSKCMLRPSTAWRRSIICWLNVDTTYVRWDVWQLEEFNVHPLPTQIAIRFCFKCFDFLQGTSINCSFLCSTSPEFFCGESSSSIGQSFRFAQIILIQKGVTSLNERSECQVIQVIQFIKRLISRNNVVRIAHDLCEKFRHKRKRIWKSDSGTK